MAPTATRPKDANKVKAGRIGSRARWAGHAPITVRMTDLDPAMRRMVAVLVEAAKAEAARAESAPEDDPATR